MSKPYHHDSRAARRQLELAAAAIANERIRRQGGPRVENILGELPRKERQQVLDDARVALVAVSLPQICIALEDAVKLIRQWHGMGMDEDNEREAWKIYSEKAPEMQSIMLALDTLRGER